MKLKFEFWDGKKDVTKLIPAEDVKEIMETGVYDSEGLSVVLKNDESFDCVKIIEFMED